MVSLSGLLPEDEALESPQAHVVTRWVGADPAEALPDVTRFELPGTGVVLLCSDGLWESTSRRRRDWPGWPCPPRNLTRSARPGRWSGSPSTPAAGTTSPWP